MAIKLNFIHTILTHKDYEYLISRDKNRKKMIARDCVRLTST